MGDSWSMSCPSCGTEAAAGAKFCSECGTPLARACPSCGTPADAAAKFCAECGTPLDAAATAPSAPAAASTPVAERRLVTVLFADLVGFTTQSEARDAEETRELLSRYFETARNVDRALRRPRREVHRRRGDGALGRAGRPGGRRRARRPGSARARLRGRGARRGRPRRERACSPVRPRSPSAPTARAWSRGISSTPPPAYSRPPSRAPCWSATRRAARVTPLSPTKMRALTS